MSLSSAMPRYVIAGDDAEFERTNFLFQRHPRSAHPLLKPKHLPQLKALNVRPHLVLRPQNFTDRRIISSPAVIRQLSNEYLNSPEHPPRADTTDYCTTYPACNHHRQPE